MMLASLWLAAINLMPALRAGAQGAQGPRLDFPAGIATDGVAAYVANSRNDTVVKIDLASHVISAVAGKLFTSGSSDGRGDAALLSSPDGMALVGNALYVADTDNSTLRKIDLARLTVATAAGTANISGTEDGPASAAHFNMPTQIAADGKAIYITDTGNSTIRKLNLADATVSTIGGQAQTEGSADGPASKSSFARPRGIATDGKFVYVSDTANQTIRKIDPSDNLTTTIAGQAGTQGLNNGAGKQATFNDPEALVYNGGNLYIADADNHAIRKLSLADGSVSTLTLVNGHIGSGIAVSKDGRTLYLSDTTENSIQALDLGTNNVAPLYSQSEAGAP